MKTSRTEIQVWIFVQDPDVSQQLTIMSDFPSIKIDLFVFSTVFRVNFQMKNSFSSWHSASDCEHEYVITLSRASFR